MWFRSFFSDSKARPIRRAIGRPAMPRRLAAEALDDRIVPASLSVADATILEGNDGVRSALVRVNLSGPSTKTVTVKYSTAAGTAQAGIDFQLVTGQLTFAPGEFSKSIAVPVYGDRVGEHNETFFVMLNGAKGAKLGDSQGVVSIVDDEPRITINNVAMEESYPGTRIFQFDVRLSVASNEVVTVNFATADGAELYPDPTHWATVADNDYVATSGTLTFAPGETMKTISVEVFGDYTPESDEYFFVNLSGASGNYFIETSQAKGWIIDDDSDNGWGGDGGIGP